MNRLTRVCCLAALLVGAALLRMSAIGSAEPPKEAEPQAADEMKKLQGTWRVIRHDDASGTPTPAKELENWFFEFKKDLLTIVKDGGIAADTPFKYTLDPSKKPKAIDVYFSGDPKEPTAGIYKLEGDELTLCMISGFRNGKVPPRPTEFKASDKAPYTVFVLKKMKDAKPAKANVFVHPEKLTPKDKLVDGPGEKASAIEIKSDTTLIWIDLVPDAKFAHATEYVLITADGARSAKGSWWPVLNGKPLFRDTKPYKAEFPLSLTRE